MIRSVAGCACFLLFSGCGGSEAQEASRPADGAGSAATGGTGGDTATGGARASGGRGDGGQRLSSGGVATGGNAVTGGTAGAAGGSTGSRYSCANPAPVTGPIQTGLVYCEGGFYHRPEITACTAQPVPASAVPSTLVDAPCRVHEDCTARPHGYCSLSVKEGVGPVTASCVYGCLEDAECGPGMACICGDPYGSCVRAACSSDDACQEGTPCVFLENTRELRCGFQCRTAGDCAWPVRGHQCISGACVPPTP